ncbi:MAG: hypothetical protein EOP56_14920 [Sphingobacteriales bacterium]|nr:MAG: hypothetical protein EOP56_14920 [Sphingobacteriales bacterium]
MKQPYEKQGERLPMNLADGYWVCYPYVAIVWNLESLQTTKGDIHFMFEVEGRYAVAFDLDRLAADLGKSPQEIVDANKNKQLLMEFENIDAKPHPLVGLGFVVRDRYKIYVLERRIFQKDFLQPN